MGVSTLAIQALIAKSVVESISLFRFKSTNIPNLARKSASMIGLFTLAKRKVCGNVRRSPRFNVSNLVPYVSIFVSLAAERLKFGFLKEFLTSLYGTTDRSAPVSIKNFNEEFLS